MIAPLYRATYYSRRLTGGHLQPFRSLDQPLNPNAHPEGLSFLSAFACHRVPMSGITPDVVQVTTIRALRAKAILPSMR